jgi:hypothetical protein
VDVDVLLLHRDADFAGEDSRSDEDDTPVEETEQLSDYGRREDRLLLRFWNVRDPTENSLDRWGISERPPS